MSVASDDTNDCVSEDEFDASKLLRNVYKIRKDRVLKKGKRSNIDQIKHIYKGKGSGLGSSFKVKTSKIKIDQHVISRELPLTKFGQDERGTKYLHDKIQIPYRGGISEGSNRCHLSNSSAERVYERSEKSRVLETMKQTQKLLSNKKRYISKNKLGQDKPKIGFDWSLEVLQKKYRCNVKREQKYQQYLNDLEVEKSMHCKEEVYVSDVIPIKQHPLQVELKVRRW